MIEQVSTHELVLLPLSTQLCLAPLTLGQSTPKHGSLTQKLFVHFLPSGHGNSPGLHANAH